MHVLSTLFDLFSVFSCEHEAQEVLLSLSARAHLYNLAEKIFKIEKKGLPLVQLKDLDTRLLDLQLNKTSPKMDLTIFGDLV